MVNLTGRIVDFYDDPNFIEDPRSDQLFVSGELPSYDTLDKLPDSSFAVKIASARGSLRKYPVNTKTAAQASAEYFILYGNTLPPELQKEAQANLTAACRRHGLTEMGAKVAEVEVNDGLEATQIKIASSQSVAAQEDLIFRKLAELTPKQRTQVAESFMAAHGEDAFTKRAFWDYCPKEEFGPYIDGAMKDRRDKLAIQDFAKVAMLDPLMARKEEGPQVFAEALAEFDKLAGFTDMYTEGLKDPYLSVYGGHSFPEEKRMAKVAYAVAAAPRFDEGTSLHDKVRELEAAFPRHTESFSKMARHMRENYDVLIDRMDPEAYTATALYFELPKLGGLEDGESTAGADMSYDGMPGNNTANQHEHKRERRREDKKVKDKYTLE